MSTPRLFRFLGLLSLACLFFSGAARAVPVRILYQDPAGTGFYDNTPATPVGGNNGKTLGEQRRIALEYAISRWSNLIKGNIVIGVQAVSVSPGRKDSKGNLNFLASAQPLANRKDWTKGTPPPLAGVIYPSALSTELANLDIPDDNGSTYDIQINHNISWDAPVAGDADQRIWYYGLDAKAPAVPGFSAPDFDFVGVMLHEFCHGLGFGDFWLDATNGTYPSGQSIWDYFMTGFSESSSTFLSLQPAARLAFITSDGGVFFSSPILNSHTPGGAMLYTPSTFDGGSSISHFDEALYSTAGSINELMTPIDSFSTQAFGDMALDVLQDMGYQMQDTQAPVAAISVPVSGGAFRSSQVPVISGTAIDKSPLGDNNAAGILRVSLALNDGTGKYYNWLFRSFDSTTFNYNAHMKNVTVDNVPISTGTRHWNFTLPSGLADGSYRVSIQAVDQLNQGSDYVYSSFTLDNAASPVSFGPFADNDTVFNLDPLFVVSPSATSVTMLFLRNDGGITREWDGTQWITTNAAPLPTTQVASGVFGPNFTLPGRGDWPAGVQLSVSATSKDAAGNTATATIHLNRTAVDTTPPTVSFIAPDPSTVYANPYLPLIYGGVRDDESGIANVTLTLTHFLPGGGFEFWNGASWSSTGTNLPTSYNLNAAQWTAPYNWALPSGASLPNGSYSFQATATNKETPAGVTAVGVNFSVDYHQSFEWLGGFNDGSWDDSRNWTSNGFYSGIVPGTNDIVTIATSAAGAPRIPNGDLRTVYKLVLGTGAYSGRGTITATHGMDWTGGFINGTVNIPQGGVLNISGPDTKFLYAYLDYGYNDTAQPGVLNNAGTATWTGAGGIQAQYGNNAGTQGVFNNTGTLHIQTSAGMTQYGLGAFLNSGTVDQTVTTATTLFDIPVTNTGLIQVATGILQFAEGSTGVSNGRYDLTGNNAVQFIGGTSTLGDGVSFTGTGSVLLSGGTVQLSSSAIPANVSLAPGIALIITNGGTLSKDGNLIGGGTLAWTGGLIAGTLTTSATIPVVITGSDTKLLYAYAMYGYGDVHGKGTLNILGSTTWSGTGELQLQYGGVINNSGIFEMRSDATLDTYGGGTFNNTGTLRKTTTTGTSSIVGDVLVNTGAVIDVRSGLLSLQGSQIITDGSSITGAGRLRLDSGALTLNGQITGAGSFELAAGNLYGTHTLTNASMHWTGGIINGATTIGANATLAIEGTATKTLYGYNMYATGSTALPGIINNNGATVWTGGEFQIQYSSSFNNVNGATFNNNGSFTIQTDMPLSQYGGGNFVNNGTVTKDTTTGVTPVTTTFTNPSTVTVKTGRLQLGGGGTDSGTFNTTTAALEFNGGTHVFNNGLHFTGTGRTTITADTVQFASTATNNVQLDTGFVLELATHGTLSGNATFIGGGTLNWTGGTITGTPTISGSTLLDISGPDSKLLYAYGYFASGDTTAKGSLEIISKAIIRDAGGLQLQYNAAINNHGLFDIQSDAPFGSYGGGAVNNSGILRKSAGALTTLDGIVTTSTNTGVFDVLSGVLSLNAGGNSLALNTNFTGAGRTRLDAGDITIAGNTGGNGHFELAGGELRGGPVFTAGTLHWTGGTITGYVGIGASAFLDISGPNTKILSGYNLYAANNLNLPGYVINGGTATFSGAGSLSIQYAATSGALTGGQFYNTGTFNVRTTALIDQVVGGTFVNAGTLNLGTAADASRTVFNINAGFQQTAAGTLNLSFKGKDPVAPAFDQVVFGTTATLDGKLNAVLLNGYSPAVGDTFKVLTYASHTGSFTSLLSPGVAMSTTYNATDLTLACTAITAPFITAQPLSHIVTAGQPVTFTVAASGEVTTYQWLKNNVAIANAKAATYTIPAAASTSAGAYTVKLTNKFGTTTSTPAKLAVIGLPAVPVTLNQDATLACTLTATAPATTPATVLSYQWSKDGTALANAANPANILGAVTGATTAKLSITKAAAGNAGAYICTVTMADPLNPGTPLTYTSGAFTFSVTLRPVVNAYAPGTWIVSGNVTGVVTAQNSPTSFTCAGLPTGVTMSKLGQITGQPTLNLPKATDYPLTITASNAAGASAPYKVTVTVLPLQAGAQGIFNGLIARHPLLGNGHGGSFNVTVTNIGVISGKVILSGVSYVLPNLRLQANTTGNPSASLPITLKAPLHSLTLAFNINLASGELTGSVTDATNNTVTTLIDGWRSTFNGTTIKAPQAAVYNAALVPDASLIGTATTPGNLVYPQGRGYGTLTITAAGAATWAGKTADGGVVTCSTTIGPAGQVPLHSMLYTAVNGSVHGWLTAAADSLTLPANNHLHVLDGTVDWEKAADATTSTNRIYKAAIPLHNLTVIGGEYVKVAVNGVALGLADHGTGTQNAGLNFTEGGLTGPTTGTVVFVPAVNATAPDKSFRLVPLVKGAINEVVTMPATASNPAGLTFALTNASGAFTGGFTLKNDPDPTATHTILLSRAVTYYGLVIPRVGFNKGVGYFLLPKLPQAAQGTSPKTTLTTSAEYSGMVVLDAAVP